MTSQNQNFWIAGTRCYGRKKGATKKNGNSAWIDFGVISSTTPATSIEKVSLDDPDGGIKQEVASQATQVTEQYSIVTRNMSDRNLAMAYLSDFPDDSEIASAALDCVVSSFPGMLARPETGEGEPAVGLAGIAYIVNVTNVAVPATPLVPVFTEDEITGIAITTGIITMDDTSGFSPADKIIITNEAHTGSALMTDTEAGNVGTYTVDSVTDATHLVLTEESRLRLVASAASISVKALSAPTLGTLLYPGTDYSVSNTRRGIIHMISVSEGGAFAGDAAGQDGAGDLQIGFQQAAIGKYRRSVPNTNTVLEMEFDLMMSRDNFGEENRRYIPKVSVTFNASDINADDYSSLTFDITVLKDESRDTEKTGHMLRHTGPERRLS